jgi:hypothetical protein
MISMYAQDTTRCFAICMAIKMTIFGENMKKKIKLFLWLPQDPEDDYVEIYSRDETVLSDPLYDWKSIRNEMNYWRRVGFDISPIETAIKDKVIRKNIRAIWRGE